MSSYNVGVNANLNGAPQATAFTFTIPSGSPGTGVQTGDVMLVVIDLFTYTSASPAISTPTSGGGSWQQIGSGLANAGAVSGLSMYASLWYRVATSGDPGSTFTVSFTGTQGATNAFYWSASLNAYTGFYTASPIGNVPAVNVSTTTQPVCPTSTTARSGSWALQIASSVPAGETITAVPAGTTQRSLYNPGDGVDTGVADSNGSVGAAGTAIGGGTYTAPSSGYGYAAWTVELCTVAAAAPPSEVPIPPQIFHPLWEQLEEVAAYRSTIAPAAATPVATTYNLMDGVNGRPGNGPATATASSGNLALGNRFYVTQGGMYFLGYRFWVCASGSQPTTPQQFALWSTQNATGQVVPGSVITSGTLTAGAWNYVPLPNPIPLSLYGEYEAVTSVNGNYPSTATQFGSGNTYAAGIINGPLVMFSDFGATNPGSYATANPASSTSSSNPVAALPTTSLSGANVWLDVAVTNVVPSGYNGTYRLWPNRYDADYVTTTDSSINYVIGTEIVISTPVNARAIWYYVAAGQGGSGNQWATSADIWNVHTQQKVATIANPVWLNGVTNQVDGQSNSGRWVYCQLSGWQLPAGDYRVSIYNGNGSPNGWGAERLGYWQAHATRPVANVYTTQPPGTNGITNGPLYAPSTPNASTTLDYSTGLPEPGQSVFAVGPPNKYPNTYVGAGTGGNYSGPALFQNYWVDLEVDPIGVNNEAPNLPQIPHGLFFDLVEDWVYRNTIMVGGQVVTQSVTFAGSSAAITPDANQISPVTITGTSVTITPDSQQIPAQITLTGAATAIAPDSNQLAPTTLTGSSAAITPDSNQLSPTTLTASSTLGNLANINVSDTSIAGSGSWASSAVQLANVAYSASSAFVQTCVLLSVLIIAGASSVVINAVQQAIVGIAGLATATFSTLATAFGTVTMSASSAWSGSTVQTSVTSFAGGASVVFGNVVQTVKAVFAAIASFVASGTVTGQSGPPTLNADLLSGTAVNAAASITGNAVNTNAITGTASLVDGANVVSLMINLEADVNNDSTFNLQALTLNSIGATTPLNITNYTPKLVLKANSIAADNTGTTFTTGEGLTVVSDLLGQISWVLPHTNASASAAGTYWWRWDLLDEFENVTTVLYGNLYILAV